MKCTLKKLHYYRKVSCVKTFKRRLLYFLCCIFSKYGFYNCQFQIIIVPKIWNLNSVSIFYILCSTVWNISTFLILKSINFKHLWSYFCLIWPKSFAFPVFIWYLSLLFILRVRTPKKLTIQFFLASKCETDESS